MATFKAGKQYKLRNGFEYKCYEVMEKQGGYKFLDVAPRTITGKAHRPAYGSDGDYFSKASADDVFDAVYQLMSETNPEKYPDIY